MGMVHAKGVNGQIDVDGDWLTIHRRGLGRLGHSAGDRRIPLAQITAVQMRRGGLINGFIRITIPGAPVARGGLRNAQRDENAVMFRYTRNKDFDAVRQAIESYIAARATGTPGPSTGGVAGQLAQLAELHRTGTLSDAEYQAAKARVIGPGHGR